MWLLRSIARSFLLLMLLLAACVDGQVRKLFFGLKPGAAGALWVHDWCRRIVLALGVRCDWEGPLPTAERAGLALVSNHLSYLDILLYASITPMIMVSKTEVRSWPLLGWITAQAGTVYVERADVKGGKTQSHADVNAAMAEAFGSGLPVLFFPEGTTTDGMGVLPFRRGLFHSVIYGRIPMRAAALAYSLEKPNRGASVASEVCYWGEMIFGPHLFRCLGLRGVQAQVRFGSDEVEGQDRFVLARNAHAKVAELYEELAQPTVTWAADAAEVQLAEAEMFKAVG